MFFDMLEDVAMTDSLLSVEQVAERLGGISRWTLYAWMSKGKLRKTKVGSRVMVAEHDLQEFLAKCNPHTRSESASVPAQ
jgi:excisionase family DNA binding protein